MRGLHVLSAQTRREIPPMSLSHLLMTRDSGEAPRRVHIPKTPVRVWVPLPDPPSRGLSGLCAARVGVSVTGLYPLVIHPRLGYARGVALG
jgi:hypothetical protein